MTPGIRGKFLIDVGDGESTPPRLRVERGGYSNVGDKVGERDIFRDGICNAVVETAPIDQVRSVGGEEFVQHFETLRALQYLLCAVAYMRRGT